MSDTEFPARRHRFSRPVIWIYRLLALLNACILAFSLFLAFSALGTSSFTIHKAAILGWPVPQAAGLWAAARAKRAGKVAPACSILVGQLAVAGGLTIAWLAVMLAGFPS